MARKQKKLRAEVPSIPSHILEAISRGECTLFLGAGASRAAGAPSGDELADFITTKFLNDSAKDWGLNLASAASLACAQPGTDRGVIERFVRDKLSQSAPSAAHLKIPWFRWRAIVTTNYDSLIEKSYDEERRAVQKLVSVLKEEDLPEIGSAGADFVPLLKPHGSSSAKNRLSLGLEDIYQAKQERRLLFTYIELLHLMGPVIYIGYSFKDIHILDMIYDLTNRLGPYRKPILFVTLQNDPQRAEKERHWIQGPLKGVYLPFGFEEFIDSLAKQMTPAIVPSIIIKQMAPCKTLTFASIGERVSDAAFYQTDSTGAGEWEYWLTYSINSPEGYAGVIFQRTDETLDISKYKRVTLELQIPKVSRKDEHLELKLESTLKHYELLIPLRNLKGTDWKKISRSIDMRNAPTTRLRRIVLADNGERVKPGNEYKIGLRRIRFE